MKHDITILKKVPFIINMAKEMIKILPRGKEKDKLVKQILKIKKDIIDLDVLVQDNEWGILETHLKREMNNHETNKKFYSEGDDEIGIRS